MIRDTAAGLRYARSWLSGRADVAVEELRLDRGDRTVPATLLLPARPRGGPRSAWIALHGATVPGRAHPQLVRFARAVAHAGAAVLVPEVPEWAALRLAPALTAPTVRAALPALAAAGLADVPVGLMGFSFGAPQAVTMAAEPALRERLGCVAAFGGYADLSRTVRFLFFGEHEWKGRRYRSRVDPYGRWIVGANYLARTPGWEDAGDVAEALRALAADAGSRRVPSWDPRYDALKEELARRVARERRRVFETFAPPSGADPDRTSAEALIEAMSAAMRDIDPLMEPGGRLREVRLPVRVMHGRADALIPFTESLRMAELLAASRDVRVTITSLFAHTEESAFPWGARGVLEAGRFVRALGRVLRSV